jgi:phosphatidate cytidylyltransferase
MRKIDAAIKKGFNYKRVAVAVILIPVLFVYVYKLPASPYFLGLLLVISMLCLTEFFAMYNMPARIRLPAVLTGGAVLYVVCVSPHRTPEAFFAGITFLLLLRLFTGASPSGSMKELGPVGIGFLYITGLLSYQWSLRSYSQGREYIFLLYIAGWFADSAAYYIGTYLGKRKLCPVISPNKTYEGAVGSVAGGAAGAVLAVSIFNMPDITTSNALVIGAVLGTATIAGDLIESMFKRDAGAKDSGSLIPGHGGLLDKLDGFLVSGPVLYFILKYY